MSLFRRREPLHVRLAREGGMLGEARPLDPRPAWQEVAVHGVERAREWDATVTVEEPGIEADAARFVALPDGALLVEEGPDSSLRPLADAVEQELKPPYRARAVRQEGDLWAVQARRIEVLDLPGLRAETIDVTRTAEGRTVSIDDERGFGSLPQLEEVGERAGPEYAVHAERLDGDLWEVRASPL